MKGVSGEGRNLLQVVKDDLRVCQSPMGAVEFDTIRGREKEGSGIGKRSSIASIRRWFD